MPQEPRSDLVNNPVSSVNLPRRTPPKLNQVFVTESPSVAPKSIVVTEGIGVDGQITSDDRKMVAKRVGTSYLVRFSQSGNDRGRVMNPFGIYYDKEDLLLGRYEFREVSAKCYVLYMNFLLTQSDSYLELFERTLLDG